jgi:hypothetical protein
LFDYTQIATALGENAGWFAEWFEKAIDYAEKNWSRPESVFQHIPRLMAETIKNPAV